MWWQKNLVKYQKVSKYYEHHSSLIYDKEKSLCLSNWVFSFVGPQENCLYMRVNYIYYSVIFLSFSLRFLTLSKIILYCKNSAVYIVCIQ